MIKINQVNTVYIFMIRLNIMLKTGLNKKNHQLKKKVKNSQNYKTSRKIKYQSSRLIHVNIPRKYKNQ